MALKT
ncbi:hypothetical protein OIU77_012127, partial [Salix suchowensis]